MAAACSTGAACQRIEAACQDGLSTQAEQEEEEEEEEEQEEEEDDDDDDDDDEEEEEEEMVAVLVYEWMINIAYSPRPTTRMSSRPVLRALRSRR